MAGLPRLVQPMLATRRHQLPADEVRYGWEFKWDGLRAVAYVSGTQVRLLSRTGHDMTASYPELDVLAGRVQVPAILDGEIVALHGGRPDFGVLQSRMHVRRPRARLIGSVPVQLYVFDLLYRGEDSLLLTLRASVLREILLSHVGDEQNRWSSCFAANRSDGR